MKKQSILYLEDNKMDVEIVESYLDEANIEYELTNVDNRSDFISALGKKQFDIILLDYSLPSFDGLSALAIIKKSYPDIPAMMISGTLGEEQAIETIKAGAIDYILKQQMSRFIPSFKRAIKESEEHRKHKRAEQKLGELNQAIKQTLEGIAIADMEGKFVFINPAWAEMHGYQVADLIGKPVAMLDSPEDKKFFPKVLKEIEKKGFWRGELQRVRKDGSSFPAIMTSSLVTDNMKRPIGIVSACLDITERKHAEKQIMHLNSVLKAIRNVNQLIVTEKDRDALLSKVCDILVDARGYNAVWIGLLEDGDNISKVTSSGLGKDTSFFSEKMKGGDQPLCIKNAMARKETFIIVDKFEECRDCSLKDTHTDNEVAIIRIEHNDRLFGMLAVSFSLDVVVEEEEKGLLREVASDISFALHDMEQEKARKQAEEKFRNLAEESPNMIFINRRGRVVYANKKCKELMGYEREEFYSPDFDFLCLIAPEYKDLIKERFGKHSTGKEVAPYEYALISKAGKRISVIFTSKLINYEGENAILGIITDITERKQAEEKGKEHRENIELLSKIAMQFVEFPQDNDIYNFIGEQLQELTGNDSYIVINSIDEETSISTIRAVLGMGNFTDKISKLLGRHPVGMTFDIEDTNIHYTDGKMHLYKEGLYELLLKTVPKTVCKYLGKILNIKEIYVIDLAKKERFFGSAVILLKEGASELKNKEIIETFINQASIAIQKRQAEELLRESETRFKNLYSMMRLMSDNLPNLIWVKDMEGKFLFVNKACSEILLDAKDTDEPIGKTDTYFADRMKKSHPEIPDYLSFGEKCVSSDLTVLETEKPTRFDESGNVKGAFLFLDVYKAPFNDENGNIIGTVGYARVVTKEKQMEKKFRESEEKYRLIVENAHDGVEITQNDKIIYTNVCFAKMLGYTIDELTNVSFSQIFTKQAIRDIYKRKSKRETNKLMFSQHKTTMIKKNGNIIDVDIKYEIIDYKGKSATFAIIRDITENKRAEEKIKAALKKATESDRLKSAFLANMSHEIRTPMNGILGFTGLLKKPQLSGEEQAKYISIIEKSGNRLLNTINDLMDISKIEADQMEVQISKVNINNKMEDLYDFFKPQFDKKGIRLSFTNALSKEKANINTDREKLYAVLTNLIKNAFKYTHKGRVEFGYDIKDNDLEFYVKDTGIGISADRQNAIFDRFIQADIEDKNVYEGSGLGLSISKAYVEMLGGKIRVESKEGLGSQFYFTIPYNADTETISKSKEEPEVTGEHLDKKLKILIVEDEETADMYLSIVLENIGKEILHATTGIEAIDICRKDPDIDLIMMDIKMPEMDGYEATRKIREFNKDVIIIAQTAYALVGDREKSLEAGCDDHISKPIDPTLLTELIKTHCIEGK